MIASRIGRLFSTSAARMSGHGHGPDGGIPGIVSIQILHKQCTVFTKGSYSVETSLTILICKLR